jgi:hypothetical protein
MSEQRDANPTVEEYPVAAVEPTVAGVFGDPEPVVARTGPAGSRRRMSPVVAGVVGVVAGVVLGFGGASIIHSSTNSSTPTGQFPGGGRGGYGGPGGGGFGGFGGSGGQNGTTQNSGTAAPGA